MCLFEVRIPAFERPEMLLRAVRSLQAQTYPNWRAVVYDDSKSSAVQEEFAPHRSEQLAYIRNPVSLGAARNIDQCFSPHPRCNGHYGCVMEDDNYWQPGFLALMAEALRTRTVDLILANQRVDEQGRGLRPASETTRGEWFTPGMVEPLALRASLLFMEGISNGGLVWKLNSQLDLRVGRTIRETGLQESCRSLLIGRPFLFVEEPQAVWTLMPRTETARSQEPNRIISRGFQSIRDFVLLADAFKVVDRAKFFALKLGLGDRFVQSLAYSGRPLRAAEFLHGRRELACRFFLKGLAIRATQPDPCAAFLASSRPAVL